MAQVVRNTLIVIAAALAGPIALAQETPTAAGSEATPQMIFQEALYQEVVLGDPEAAIAVYERVASAAGNDKVLAGLATLREGECYEKLGHTRRAFDLYADLIRRYGNIPQLAEAIAQKLITQSMATGKYSWFVTTADAQELLKYISFRPYEKDGQQLGIVVNWKDKAPAGGTAYGLRSGDIVTELNGIPLTSSDTILQAIDVLKKPGTFNVKLLRDGEPLTLEYKVSEAVTPPLK